MEEVISTDWYYSVQCIHEEKEDMHQRINEQGPIQRAGTYKTLISSVTVTKMLLI